MTIPNRVRACVDVLAASGGSLDERLDQLDVRGMPDEALRAELAGAAHAWVHGGFGTFSALDVLGDEIAIDQLAASEGELRLRFGKSPTQGTYYFLTARGLAVLLDDKERAATARRVLVAEAFAPYATVQCTFECWTEMVADAASSDEATLPVPRRIVRDQLAIVPLSIGPLLLVAPPEDPTSAVFTTWRAAAGPQLLLCLVDEVWGQVAAPNVTLTGPRRRKLRAALEKFEPERDFKWVTEAADWVFNSGRDAETRHTLLVYELAREWPGETPFVEGFVERAAGALEAAKTAFRMHVRDASKETLKSLQELRKTLADDVTRVVTQTRELTGSLWRDLLVVFAAVVGRFTLLATPSSEEAVFAEALLYGLAAYLAFSVGMTLYANASFMNLFRGAQAKWQNKLYGFVDPEDFKTLATGPLAEAEKVYRRTRNAAIAAYGLTIIALVAFALQSSSMVDAKRDDAGNDPAGPLADSNAATTAESDNSSPVASGGAHGEPVTADTTKQAAEADASAHSETPALAPGNTS